MVKLKLSIFLLQELICGENVNIQQSLTRNWPIHGLNLEHIRNLHKKIPQTTQTDAVIGKQQWKSGTNFCYEMID